MILATASLGCRRMHPVAAELPDRQKPIAERYERGERKQYCKVLGRVPETAARGEEVGEPSG